MKKEVLGLTALVLLAACSWNKNADKNYVVSSGIDDTSYLRDVQGCPKVHIRNNDAAIVQMAEYQNVFEVKAVGYDGFCYFNKKVLKDRAVIKPQFKITRLAESDITDVHFSYYLETVEGPAAYLGKKTYYASVDMPEGLDSIVYTANAGELGIPKPGTYNLDIYLGLIANSNDLEYKK